MPPLTGLLVLDFSTLLPGPMASMMLAEAGAEVIKIERPGRGDEMRGYVPRVDADSVNFHMLNRGKRSLTIDLKDADAVARLRPLIERADIVIEQFRPGVMARLGLGYDAVRAINPAIIYCSITGWGQDGPKAQVAAHDLNYMAETGLLGLSGGADGTPVLPPLLAADIAGGTMPAMINILLALHLRGRTGEGACLDIAMGDSLLMFAYASIGNGMIAGEWPERSGDLTSGGSPRYQIYRTADGRHLAAAPLEDKFWDNFCRIIDLPPALRAADASPEQVKAGVAERIAARTSHAWEAAFAGQDVCCSIVADLREALRNPQIVARGVMDRRVETAKGAIPALPLPIDPQFRAPEAMQAAPALGEYSL